MSVNESEWVKVHYTAKVRKDDNSYQVFETTREPVARAENIFNERATYQPLLIRAGDEKFLVPGVSKEIVGMETNKEKSIEIAPENGFGKRDAKQIETVPVRSLRKAKINPVQGASVEFRGRRGIISWVGSGRARIDYNHPLAGKTLMYDVEIQEIITDEKEVANDLIKRRFPPTIKIDDFKIEFVDDPKSLSITMPYYLLLYEGVAMTLISIANELENYLKYKKVNFTYEFDFSDKQPPQADSDATEEE